MTESRDGKLSEGGKAVKPPTYHPKSCFTFTTIQCTLLYNILCKLTNFTSALIKVGQSVCFQRELIKYYGMEQSSQILVRFQSNKQTMRTGRIYS